MTSKEWKNLTSKEKQLYKKGYISALDDMNLKWQEKEQRVKAFEEYINALESME